MSPQPKDVAKDVEGSVASSSAFSIDRGNRSSSGDSSSRASSKRKNEPPPVEVDMETRNVYCAKLLMIGVLSMAAVASAMATFLFTTHAVQNEFDSKVSCDTFISRLRLGTFARWCLAHFRRPLFHVKTVQGICQPACDSFAIPHKNPFGEFRCSLGRLHVVCFRRKYKLAVCLSSNF